MTSDDQHVMQSAVRWLNDKTARHEHVFLVTVIRTWGSSPRPAGSIMAITTGGKYTGSVSGGCVEQDLIKKLSGSISQIVFPAVQKYGVNSQEAQRFGLPCGGQLELLIEKITTSAQLTPALDAVQSNHLISRHVCLNTGETSWSRNIPETAFVADHYNIRKVFGPGWKLLIIGAGHLTRHVAQLATTLDYQVIVCDPRENSLQQLKGLACEFQTCMPDDFIKKHVNNNHCIVLALTHEPNLDDMALMEALDSKAFYVGALGSVTTNNNRRNRLKALGVSDAGIARLHGPVGLPIGSRTPAEIAIAIFAEITALRNGKKLNGKISE